MDCQFGRRQRTAEWDEIEEAPQVKRLREDKPQSSANEQPMQQEQPQEQQQQQQPPQAQTQVAAQPEPTQQAPPKFYISAPIQGYSSDNQGGCRYLFF